MHKLAIIFLLTALMILVTQTRGTYADRHHSERTACLEDEPCWDCRTMGNRVCGSGQKRCTTDFDCAKLGVVGYGVDAEMIRNAR
jgi:hypothetical protein